MGTTVTERDDKPRLVGETTMCRVGTYKNIALVAWLAYPEDDGASALLLIEKAYQRAYAYAELPIGVLVVVTKEMPTRLPGSAFRAALGTARRRWKGKLGAEAIIFPSSDWKVSLFRTMMTHIERLGSRGLPTKTFGESLPALTWLTQQLRITSPGAPLATEISVAAEALDFPGFVR